VYRNRSVSISGPGAFTADKKIKQVIINKETLKPSKNDEEEKEVLYI
jgi:hypothetical protein